VKRAAGGGVYDNGGGGGWGGAKNFSFSGGLVTAGVEETGEEKTISKVVLNGSISGRGGTMPKNKSRVQPLEGGFIKT